MHFDGFIAAILVRDGSKSKDCCLLEVFVVAFEHLLEILLDFFKDDVWIIFRELLKSKSTRFTKCSVIILITFRTLIIFIILQILCFYMLNIILLRRHITHPISIRHHAALQQCLQYLLHLLLDFPHPYLIIVWQFILYNTTPKLTSSQRHLLILVHKCPQHELTYHLKPVNNRSHLELHDGGNALNHTPFYFLVGLSTSTRRFILVLLIDLGTYV